MVGIVVAMKPRRHSRPNPAPLSFRSGYREDTLGGAFGMVARSVVAIDFADETVS